MLVRLHKALVRLHKALARLHIGVSQLTLVLGSYNTHRVTGIKLRQNILDEEGNGKYLPNSI